MELREIEIFLKLAEELHFGRTAERMYLSQSRISQTIRTLESRVGGVLFERTSRRVRLSPLGERLRDRLRPAYEEIHRAFADVREGASGITGELRISLLNFAAGGPVFGEIVRAFTVAHPGCGGTGRPQHLSRRTLGRLSTMCDSFIQPARPATRQQPVIRSSDP